MRLRPISFADGSVGRATKVRAEPIPWTEAVLQHVLVLNPDLLGVSDQLPLEIDGSSTAVAVDQLFVDDVGRFTFVELKNERADLPALAQLLSYVEHWRAHPLSEIEAGLRCVSRKGTAADVLSGSLSDLRTWAKAKSTASSKRRCPWSTWQSAPPPSQIIRRFFGPDLEAMPGAPTRIVLVAPDFGVETVKLAKLLAARYVAIELVRAEVRRDAKGTTYLSWEHEVTPPEDIETTWSAARLLWRSLPKLRKEYRLNGWADHMNKWSFSFAPIAAPAARIWIDTDESTIHVSTAVPDGWFTGTAKRDALRAKLMSRLPNDQSGGRWPTVTVPADKPERVVEAMRRFVDAVGDVLVPAAPAE